MNDKDANKIVDEFIELQSDFIKVKYSFFSKLTPVILGFLGLMVSLKSTDNSSEFSQFFFFLTILLLGLCVLCSVATLYSEVHYSKKYLENYRDEATKYILDKSENKSIYASAKVSKFYLIVEWLTIVFLILSILSLIIYSYALTF